MSNYSCFFSDFNLVNKSLPWDYDFRFVIEEISNINDKAQVTSGLPSQEISNINDKAHQLQSSGDFHFVIEEVSNINDKA